MNISAIKAKNDLSSALHPQCQYFVVRKKRLCRMTVKPGRQYCGEHEPHPKSNEGKVNICIVLLIKKLAVIR